MDQPVGSTLATSVYSQLRQDLLDGKYRAGNKLPVERVVAQYKCGLSPVREALNRLSAEGLIDRIDQRGFWVKPLSDGELQELTRTRCWLEERGLRESIANSTGQWEEQVVLALHRLSRAAQHLREQPSSRDPEWEKVHNAFHHTLISGCRSHWLISFCEQVATQMHRYRLLARVVEGEQRDCMSEHRLIAEASIDRDADRAVAALVGHYWKSAAMVSFSEPLTEIEKGRTLLP